MAYQGRKVVFAGDVFSASDMNSTIDQTVMVFAGTAARSSAIAAPSEGMVSYLQDVNEVQFYNGTVWGNLAPTPTSSTEALPYITKYYKTGRYYGHVPMTNLSSAAQTLNRLQLAPFYVTQSKTFDRLSINVSTLGAGSTVRLGIYNSSATTFLPTTVLFDAGTVDSSTTGAKEITISQTLPAGLYYLAAVPQGGTAPSTSCYLSPLSSPFFGGTITDARISGFYVDGISGVLSTITEAQIAYSPSSTPVITVRAA